MARNLLTPDPMSEAWIGQAWSPQVFMSLGAVVPVHGQNDATEECSEFCLISHTLEHYQCPLSAREPNGFCMSACHAELTRTLRGRRAYRGGLAGRGDPWP